MAKKLLILFIVIFVLISGNIEADTLKTYKNYSCQIHRVADYTPGDTNYNTLQWDTIVESETIGEFSFNVDSTGIIVPDSALYSFCGCWHVKNSGAGPITAKINSYVFCGSDTAICSQVSEGYDNVSNGQYKTINYCGTINLGKNSELKINIKASNTDLTLASDSDLPKPVAASIGLTKITNR